MADLPQNGEKGIVCEIVRDPSDVRKIENCFHLAGKITGQEVEVIVTSNPGRASAAVLAESLRNYPTELLVAFNDVKKQVRDKPSRLPNLTKLDEVMINDPYAKTGLAFAATLMDGATAVFTTAEDRIAFRAELDVFKNLSRPQED